MANDVKNISPMKLTLLVTIVPRDKEGFYIDYLQTLGSNLQMSASGHGTANKEVLEYLGLDNNDKSVIFSVIRDEKTERFLSGLDASFSFICDAATSPPAFASRLSLVNATPGCAYFHVPIICVSEGLSPPSTLARMFPRASPLVTAPSTLPRISVPADEPVPLPSVPSPPQLTRVIVARHATR